MKKRFSQAFIAVFALALMSCGGKKGYEYYQGEVRGEANRPTWENVQPFGMVYIPGGVYRAGLSDQDVNNSMWQKTKTLTIQGFYMDETEITNNEYRQFVNYCIDSIARTMLGQEFEEFFKVTTDPITEEEIKTLNYETPLWDNENPEVKAKLEQLYVKAEDRVWGEKIVDVSQIKYQYEWFDYKEASLPSNRTRPRKDFIKKEGSLNVYPDTLVWVQDFSYSYNEPMARQYFTHPAFDAYPVVGVNWNQAQYFNVWRSRFYNNYRKTEGLYPLDPFRLPTEFEWEYAARGTRDNAPYPWGGPYIRNSKGCILANFKPGRGSYAEDGGIYTVRADAYWPNDFGLYNMAGNVAEWTESAFVENQFSIMHDLNPTLQLNNNAVTKEGEVAATMLRKVIRGGSWKDVGFNIQCGTRQYEYKDSSKSFIGFRSLLPFLGRSINDKTN